MTLQLFLQTWKKFKKRKNRRAGQEGTRTKAEEERSPIENKNILSGNPVLNLTGPPQPQVSFKIKRRWDDDVVFKNCAKGVDDQKKDKGL